MIAFSTLLLCIVVQLVITAPGTPKTYFIRRGLHVGEKSNSGSKMTAAKEKQSSLGIINHASFSSSPSLLLHSPSPIDPRYLDHRTIIDVNKDFNTEPCNLHFPPSYTMYKPLFDEILSPNIDADVDGRRPIENDNNSTSSINNHANNSTVSSSFSSVQLEYKVCRSHPTGGWIPPPPPRKTSQHHQISYFPLKYDYINTNCIGNIHDFISHELAYNQSITKHYSIYIVGPGVWETVKQSACRHPFYYDRDSQQQSPRPWPEMIYQLLQVTLRMLDTLAKNTPGLLILWRTSGYYDGDPYSHVIKEMNRQAVEFIHNRNNDLFISKYEQQQQQQKQQHQRDSVGVSNNNIQNERKRQKSNFLCMDWGSAIEHRSHGKDRLRGDMQAHYGLEARVLQVQMITNLLYEHGYVL